MAKKKLLVQKISLNLEKQASIFWKFHLMDMILIRSASKKNLITYLTSHGQKKALSSENLAKFGEAGLDILEISLDGYDALQGSEKTLRGDENLIDRLEDAREKYGILYKAHQVLAPEALDETPKLLDLAERRLLPISFGLVTEFAGFFRRSAKIGRAHV